MFNISVNKTFDRPPLHSPRAFVVLLALSISQAIFCFAMLGFVFPAFPPKDRQMQRHFTYLGEEKRLQEDKTKDTVSRANAALEFLRLVPEVVQQRWTMEQFDRV